MKKWKMTGATVALALCVHVAIAAGQVSPSPKAQTGQPSTLDAPARAAALQAPQQKITAYTLPPDLYAKAKHLDQARLAFIVLSPIYFLIVLWLFLRWRIAPQYRDWAESASTKLPLQGVVFAPFFILTMDIFGLPVEILEHWELRRYDLSVQGWGSWAWDWTKGELVSVILGIIVTLIFYAVVRKSPHRWWFYFWSAVVPLGIVMVFLQPLLIDPLFHKFEPLATKDPALTIALEQMVHRAGQDVPPDRMYWMNASEKVNELNAYVTGVGGSKRIVVWDTTISKMTTPEIVSVAGHEMGHYVLNHIPKGILISAVGFLIIFYLGYRCIEWLLAWKGGEWEIRGPDDLASLPAFVLLLGVASFVLTPVTNGLSRHFEHQADQYGLEVTHGLTPDSGQVMAQAFQVLGEVDLEYPDPSGLDVLLTYDHPATRDRVRFALTYDPWSKGGTGEFVH